VRRTENEEAGRLPRLRARRECGQICCDATRAGWDYGRSRFNSTPAVGSGSAAVSVSRLATHATLYVSSTALLVLPSIRVRSRGSDRATTLICLVLSVHRYINQTEEALLGTVGSSTYLFVQSISSYFLLLLGLAWPGWSQSPNKPGPESRPPEDSNN
jgi:hypothetical protein